MVAMVAHISEVEQPGAGWLILDIERPVLRVRQFVVDVITAKQERAIEVACRPAPGEAACRLVQVRQQGEKSGRAIWWRRRGRRAEGRRQGCVLRRRNRLNKRRRQRYPERTIKAVTGTWRKVAEKLATIIINAVTCPQRQFRKRCPSNSDAWRKSPLMLLHQAIAGAKGLGCRVVPG